MFRSLFGSRRGSGDATPAGVTPAGPAAAAPSGDGASPAAEQEEAQAMPASPKTERKNKAISQHIQKMDTMIRRKLHGTGAQYNMKVVVRGERGVGKSTLLRRLQGLPYEEKYTPTPEIQTTTINNWAYRGSQDVVKVEVWDVVDKGLARGGVSRAPEGGDLEDAVSGLPLDRGSARGGRALAVLDAGVVNVYQGANAVIFMIDPYRPGTLDKVEKSLAEAPVSLPAVILLNFRDKLEEDAVAKASGKSRTPQPPPAPTPPPPPETKTSTDPPTLLKDSGDGNVAAGDGSAIAKEGVAVEAGEGGVVKEDEGGGGVGVDAWAHVATLETARAMMDRVRELDIAEGRGSGRRVSLFDCSMKNCFGLRVLYTYLNVPFLELKRQSLLQQAQIAAETLEREYRELEGFIGGHSYGNYMQHLQSSDVDPTAGRPTAAAPPGRPSISSLPTPLPSNETPVERRGSVDSHGRKEKKKKYHKDKDKDKSKKKDRHRHKGSKSSKDEREVAPEYQGKVTDAKEFAPVTKKTATEELDDFFGASSEGGSDEGVRERTKVVKAIDPAALAKAPAYDEATDSDEMPAPTTSRLKRVTAPLKRPSLPRNRTAAALATTSLPHPPAPTPVPAPRADASHADAAPAACRPQQRVVGVEAAGRAEVSAATRDPSERGAGSAAVTVSSTSSPLPAKTPAGDNGKETVEAPATGGRGTDETVLDAGRAADSGRSGGAAEEGAGGSAVVASPPRSRRGSEEGDAAEEGGGLDDLQGGEAAPEKEEAGGKETRGDGVADAPAGSDGVAPGRDAGRGDGEKGRGGVRESEQLSEIASEQGEEVEVNGAGAGLVGESEAAPRNSAGTQAPATTLQAQRRARESGEFREAAEFRTAQAATPVDRPVDDAQAGEADGPQEDKAALEGDDSSRDTEASIPASAAAAAVATEEGITAAATSGTGGLPETELAVDAGRQDRGGDDGKAEGNESGAAGEDEAATVGFEAAADGGDSGGSEKRTDARGRAKSRDNEDEPEGGTAKNGAADDGGAREDAGAAEGENAEFVSSDVGGADSTADLDPELATGGSDVGNNEGGSGGGVAEDFFAGGSTSGEDELYPGVAAAAGKAAPLGELGSGDDDDMQARLSTSGNPNGDHPPSPRLIASSVAGGGGFAAERKMAAAVGGGEALSEAAKAAVAAALASAASGGATGRRSSRGEDVSSGKSRKKKSRHKERRRKGSNSGGEEESGAGASRRSGSVGKRSGKGEGSSSRRHHRKSAV